jgi:hypothetical protein
MAVPKSGAAIEPPKAGTATITTISVHSNPRLTVPPTLQDFLRPEASKHSTDPSILCLSNGARQALSLLSRCADRLLKIKGLACPRAGFSAYVGILVRHVSLGSVVGKLPQVSNPDVGGSAISSLLSNMALIGERLYQLHGERTPSNSALPAEGLTRSSRYTGQPLADARDSVTASGILQVCAS